MQLECNCRKLHTRICNWKNTGKLTQRIFYLQAILRRAPLTGLWEAKLLSPVRLWRTWSLASSSSMLWLQLPVHYWDGFHTAQALGAHLSCEGPWPMPVVWCCSQSTSPSMMRTCNIFYANDNAWQCSFEKCPAWPPRIQCYKSVWVRMNSTCFVAFCSQTSDKYSSRGTRQNQHLQVIQKAHMTSHCPQLHKDI